MNAFEDASKLESKGMGVILAYLKDVALDGRIVLTSKGRKSLLLQKLVGDVIVQSKRGAAVCFELKTEQADKYGNFFLEVWSNLPRHTLGWMYTTEADWILYQFYDDERVYMLPVPQLKHWAFTRRKIEDYPHRPQKKRDQMNETVGACVPISIIEAEVEGVRRLDVSNDYAFTV